jgi:glycosyltransferase involved in cell wall biosynthesis
MNILFLTKEYYHEKLPNCGGTGSFISNLSKSLVNEGHTVFVFGVEKKSVYIDDFGVKVTFVKDTLSRNHIYKLARSITKKVPFLRQYYLPILRMELKKIAAELNKFISINNLQIDIIETHDFEGLSLYLDNKIPVVIRCHGNYNFFHNYFNFKFAKYKLDFEREAIAKAKNFIMVSKYSQSINHKLFNLEKSQVIYNGIDTDKFRISEDVAIIPKSIFFFGNVSYEKGADIAVSVLIEVLKFETTATLNFVGRNTNYNNSIENILIENNILNKVIFHGFKLSNEIIKIMSNAEIVILPSRGENFSLAALEMMSLSKPLICSNIPSFSELIIHNENGFIANSIQEYVNAIRLIFENKETSKDIEINARKTIVEKFNKNKLVKETLDYYNDAIINHKSKENEA